MDLVFNKVIDAQNNTNTAILHVFGNHIKDNKYKINYF